MIYLLGWIKYGDFAKELSGIENFKSNLDLPDSIVTDIKNSIKKVSSENPFKILKNLNLN